MKITRNPQEPPSVVLESLEPGDVFYIAGHGEDLYLKTDESLQDDFIQIVLLSEGVLTDRGASIQVVKVDCELLCKS